MDEKIILKGFADNELLFETVKKALLRKFEVENVNGLVGLGDKQIGEIIRARLDGRAKVEEAFIQFSYYKSSKQRELVDNPAR